MKYYLLYFAWFAIILINLSCFTVKVESTLSEKKIISPGHSGYTIQAFDYYPETDQVYYIEFNDYKDKRKYACEKLLEKSYVYKPIGHNKANSIRFNHTGNKQCPKFLIISVDSVEMAMDVDDCSEETFLKYADKFSGNLALFNQAATGPVSDEKYLISGKGNLYVQLYDKGFGYYNFSCEKYFTGIMKH